MVSVDTPALKELAPPGYHRLISSCRRWKSSFAKLISKFENNNKAPNQSRNWQGKLKSKEMNYNKYWLTTLMLYNTVVDAKYLLKYNKDNKYCFKYLLSSNNA
uniref:Uncharacterized protein n=1 Tax=Glossina austeni TaxID=7395 RepID=A0A1A9VS54_GLOAU